MVTVALLLGAPALWAEEIRCDWRLQGLQGTIARILPFVPASGEAVLTVTPHDDGVRLRFRATSAAASAEEHWTYEAELDPAARRTLRVVESSRFRGRDRSREYDLRRSSVVDLLSGLHLIRLDLPKREQEGILWSNRRLYPVAVEPAGRESREIAGRRFELLRFVVRGRRQERHRYWNQSAEVWLAAEAPNQLVEMVFKQRFGHVRLRCLPASGQLD